MVAGSSVSMLLAVALLVAVVRVTGRKSPGMCAKTEEYEATSMVTMYPLFERFSGRLRQVDATYCCYSVSTYDRSSAGDFNDILSLGRGLSIDLWGVPHQV
jgi:hypothetical protein